ncbi:MAG TPA: ABC transporter ATP-binding protein [Desulfotomaculum sp.]|nr:ABC transporter ATP-binding protein [Desulfotomaculum sp.]
MMADSEKAVLVQGLTKVFGGQEVLKGVNLEVPGGSVFALFGPNGAGKTTTLKIILNLLQPTGGKIEVLGMDGVARSQEIRSKVGYQPETPNFYYRARVENIFSLCRSLYPRWNQARVDRYCDIFDLPVRGRVSDLSKGKMTLLGMALAVGPDPELLLLDEPFTGLDPLRRRQLLQLLVEEMAGEGRTILVSSHQIQDMERIADRVAFMVRGRVILSRTVDELLRDEKKIRAAFSGPAPEGMEGWPGVRRVEREGSRLLVTVSGQVEEVAGRLSGYDGAACEVIDQTLEDIFINYAGEGLING